MKSRLTVMASIAIGSLVMPAASSAFMFIESIDGELSNSLSAPTQLTLDLGLNTLAGQIGTNGQTGATDGSDADYFRFTVQGGTELTSIFVDSRSPTSGQSFFGYTAGTQFNGQAAGDVDGFVIFSNSSGQVLDDFLGGSGTLAAGDYAFWVQETADGLVDYNFSFTTAAVPEPGAFAFLSGALALTYISLKRRR